MKTFVPPKLPLRRLDWDSFIGLLGKAHAILGRFDEVKKVSSALLNKEVLASHSDHKLMENYRKALLDASSYVKHHPISLLLIQKMHATMMGNRKASHFRDRQNWIGPENCPIEEAYFFPPKASLVPRCMENLQKYLHFKEKDPLVQVAIYFAQLLSIHPYMDGNGRVGRALISLILYKKKLTSAPLFFMSPYFREHRKKYFDQLYKITEEDDWEGWISFFLRGIVEQGIENIQLIKKSR